MCAVYPIHAFSFLLVTIEVDEGFEDSLAGWTVQVRPYGRGDLFETNPVGLVESLDETYVHPFQQSVYQTLSIALAPYT